MAAWTDKRSVIRERLVHFDVERFRRDVERFRRDVERFRRDVDRVRRDVDRVRRAANAPGRTGIADPAPIDFELFPDIHFGIVFAGEDLLAATGSGQAWLGSVAGIPGSFVTLALQGEAAHALVQLPTGERYEIAYAGSDVHRVIEIDPTGFPPEQLPLGAEPHDLGAATSGSEGSGPPAAAPAGGASVIDLMVVYTAEARDAAGGKNAIESRIMQAVALANAAYANSQVSIQNQLVHMGLIDYVEPTTDAFYKSLTDLSYTTDGYMDGIHALRNATGADVVSLLIDNWSYCGIGWINNPATTWSNSWAFNVNLWYCVGTTRTLHHEIGHNQGLNHDIGNSGSGAVFPYSYGLQVDGGFHTVMAYDSRFGCATPCPPINYFSNPSVSYLGTPTGIAEQADNARSLNETRAFVAAWRASAQPDTDGDGVPDGSDNCLTVANAGQADADVDGYGNACDGDLDNNGFVTPTDTNIFRAALIAFFPTGAGDADMNDDGYITPADTPYFVAQLGLFQPGPSGLACAGTVPCAP